jgi:hypothetical protein
MVCFLGKGVFLALLEPFFFPFGAFSCLGLFAYFFLPLHTFLPTPLFSASWVRKLTTTRPDCVFTNVFRTTRFVYLLVFYILDFFCFLSNAWFA